MNNFEKYYYDYIGATGTYEINEYIDTTSNILNSNINITSNILNSNINFVDYKYDKLINEKTENNLINTYIYNSNIGGEIRFYNKKPPELNRPDYSVRINSAGYLEVYYNYNAFINLLEQSGYKNIVNEIISSKASINLQGGFIGTLQLETAGIIGYLIKNRPQNEVGELLEAPAFNYSSPYTAITSGLNAIGTRLQNFLFNNNYVLFLGTPIAVGIFALGQYGADVDASHIIAQAVINQYNSNTVMTTQQKRDLLDYGSNLYVNKLNSALSNLSNVNVNIGFINSNITTQQFIPKLKSNEITLNNKTITKFSLESIDNWVKTTNGWYWDATLGNLGINATPNLQDFLIVGGQTVIQGNLYASNIYEGTTLLPNKYCSYTSLNSCNYANLNTTSLTNYYTKNSVDTLTNMSNFYNKTSIDTFLNGKENTLTFLSPLTRTINNIGINLNSYVPFTALSASNYITNSVSTLINYPSYSVLNSSNYANLNTTSLTNYYTKNNVDTLTNMSNFYNKTTTDGKYLQLSGGVMSGQITGVSTLNGTTGIFGQLYTTNNTNVSLPSLGVAGGTGDKIIISSGGAAVYPYSIGRNTNDLWFSSPSGASFKFYTGGTNTFDFSSNGNLTTNGNVCIGTSQVSANTKLSISGSSSGYSEPLVDIKQLAGWTGNYALQVSGYTNLGGIRINGADTGNTIYQTLTNSDLAITQNPANTTGGNIVISAIGAGGNIIFYTSLANERMRINSSGNVGIGTNNPNSKLDIRGNFSVANGVWNISADGVYRTHYGANDVSYYCCGSGSTTGHMFMNSSYANVMTIYNNGNIGINTSAPRTKLDVNGIVNFHNGSPFGSQFMTAGSLTIGGTNVNYGGQYGVQWGYANTAGLLMECLDNTEICIHDSSHRVASFMYYEGGANANNTNKFTMGRPMGWDSGRASIFNFCGNVGFFNPSPTTAYHYAGGILGTNSIWIGRPDVDNCIPLIMAINNPSGFRNFLMGWDLTFWWCIGDFGNANGNNNYVRIFCIYYAAPSYSLYINNTGYCTMQYGYGGGSDIKIKTDIRTIDNALWKVKQLRGIYYTHITEGTKGIGLIAQEVEHILPEAVFYDETNDLKSISYQNLVGLLINAIKEQQEIIDNQQEIIDKQGKQIENIIDILNRNNIK